MAVKTALLLPRKSKVDWGRLAKRAFKSENDADELCHKILREADKTFITPIDREDIQELAKNLDNIIDLTENVISNVTVYKVKRIHREFYEFVNIIIKAIKEVSHLVSDLKHKGRNEKEIKRHVVRLHSLENKGDLLLKKALKHLFNNGDAPVEVIKWKDIYENMEEVLDECEDTSDTIEKIIVKNF